MKTPNKSCADTESIEKVKSHYETLCRKIGSRHLGSLGEKNAAEYITNCLKSYGYTVFAESYEAPGWNCSSYSFQLTEGGKEIPSCPCFYSNSCDLNEFLTVLDKDALNKIEELDLKNSFCFVDVRPDVLAKYGRNEFAETLDKKGAAAAIFISDHSDIYDTKFVRNPNLKQLAAVCISGNTAYEINKNAATRFRLQINAEKFTFQSLNIVGSVSNGNAKIVVGAHYDTAPGIEGATDNASGTASLLEVARLLRWKFKNYSIDFVAFSGEELATMGSRSYIKHHSLEIPDIKCMINLDANGTSLGKLKICIPNSDSIAKLAEPILSGYKIKIDSEYPKTSDEGIFFDKGIPVVLFSNDNNKYCQMHTPNDTLDRISFRKTAESALIATDIILAIDKTGALI